VLLFDEPLSNLDARLRVQMRDEIRDLQQRLAITTIYVTHDQEEAMAVSDRIAVMSGGSVVQDGSAEDLYHRPATEFVARFVGRVNLIAAEVKGAHADALDVEALGGVIRVRSRATGARVGDRVQLVLRPEAIVLAATPVATALSGTIEARTFLGEKVEYRVRCGGESLQVVGYNAGPGSALAAGSVVGVTINAEATTVVPQ